MNKKRVLSGLQPSGKLHIGNYFGAIKQYVDLQQYGNEVFYFVANYHAMTSISNKQELEQNSIDIVLDLLALGLKPEESSIFMQSHIPEVCELAWLLSTVTPMSLLEKCHSYKDKLAKGILPMHGLFAYPVLMAADILIYGSEIVPVGKDQKQHLEVTRDIAVKFNMTYDKDVFKLPEPFIVQELAVVPGTDGQKMSKSYHNTIEIFMAEKKLRKTINKIVTDSKAVEEVKAPETCNVYALLKLFLDEAELQIWDARYRNGGMGYGEAKKALFEAMMDKFGYARKKREELKNNMDYINDVLKAGAENAKQAASVVLDNARSAAGIL